MQIPSKSGRSIVRQHYTKVQSAQRQTREIEETRTKWWRRSLCGLVILLLAGAVVGALLVTRRGSSDPAPFSGTGLAQVSSTNHTLHFELCRNQLLLHSRTARAAKLTRMHEMPQNVRFQSNRIRTTSRCRARTQLTATRAPAPAPARASRSPAARARAPHRTRAARARAQMRSRSTPACCSTRRASRATLTATRA